MSLNVIANMIEWLSTMVSISRNLDFMSTAGQSSSVLSMIS